MESAIRAVVRRRQTQHLGKLSGSASDWAATEQSGNYLGGRTGRQAYPHLPATAWRRLPICERSEAEQDQKGRSRHIYLPNIPEAAIAMLACARIGAVHSLVFGGFSADSIRDRIADSGAIAVVTADGGYRRGGIVPLKKNVDDALHGRTSVKRVIVFRRAGNEIHMEEGRVVWWNGELEYVVR